MTGNTSTSPRSGSDAGPPLTGAEIARELEVVLTSGELHDGEKLPSERTLAEDLGVSRPVVREALRSLEAKGLVVVAPGRGTYLRRLDLTEEGASVDLAARRGRVSARHVITVRTMLECEAAEIAAENRTAADIEEMRRVLRELDDVVDNDAESAAQLDVAFHESIAVASHNPLIQVMFGSIRAMTHGLVLRSLTDRLVRHEAAPIHEAILDAIVSRDAAAARKVMSEHLAVAGRHYGDDLDKPLAEVLFKRAGTHPRVAASLTRASVAVEEVARQTSED